MSEIWKPNVTVAAIVEREGRLLLVEEQTEEGLRFNQPAGHLEPAESLLEATVRETLEETGYLVRPRRLVGIYRWPHVAKERVYLRFAFFAEVCAHEPQRALDAGIVRAVWLDEAELAEARPRFRSPLVARCIEDYRAGASYGLEILRDLI
ncbi:MAG: NUDIX hydrolase [Betaproteobacteria bacterium]|nr:NUDIX hydrolase [Betaproteobacteria bacterium]